MPPHRAVLPDLAVVRMWRALLATLVVVGCTLADVPELYHGRAGVTVLAVPSRIAMSVLYDGESDWTVPTKPKAKCTDRDPIRQIELFIDLDHSDRIITDQAAHDRLLQSDGDVHPPTLFGHILG